MYIIYEYNIARVQFYHLAVDQILAQSLFGIFENWTKITYMKTYLRKENKL